QGFTDGAWANFYSAIRLSNFIIKYGPEIPDETTRRDQLIAEAYFLRAFCYLHLLKNWGEVPIRTEPTEDLNVVGVPKSSKKDVYVLIVADLKRAEEGLPIQSEQSGRATKGLAQTALADIYLYNEDWQLARNKAKEIIDAGTYSLVEVSTPEDFENIFGADIITHTEDIFSLKFTRQNGTWFAQFFHQPDNIWSSRGFGNFWGLPNKYPILINWDRNDLRYQFNVYTTYTARNGQTKTNPNGWVHYAKFKDPGFNPDHGNNIPLYRYPEVLLIFAEAENELNGPSEAAIERFNQVHRRGYGHNPLLPSPDDVVGSELTKATFKSLIIQERAYEFICEGKRWFDLLRTNTVKQVISAAKGIEVSDAHLYFPIPVQEINSNPDISK